MDSPGWYTVTSPAGYVVLQAEAGCRYSRWVELALLDAGYTIRLGGKRLTRKELAQHAAKPNMQGLSRPRG